MLASSGEKEEQCATFTVLVVQKSGVPNWILKPCVKYRPTRRIPRRGRLHCQRSPIDCRSRLTEDGAGRSPQRVDSVPPEGDYTLAGFGRDLCQLVPAACRQDQIRPFAGIGQRQFAADPVAGADDPDPFSHGTCDIE